MASPRDLVTILYQPRETMRRVLDGGGERWTIALIVLAYVCSSFNDPDILRMQRQIPDIALSGTLAIVALTIIVAALCWVLIFYGFSWLVTIAGRWLEGHGEYADVRAALAWAFVPVIWSVFVRIPLAIYAYRLLPVVRDKKLMVSELIARGGCTLAVIVFALQLVLYVWIAFVGSSTVAEALHFTTGKGVATLAIVFALPFVIGIAAFLALRT